VSEPSPEPHAEIPDVPVVPEPPPPEPTPARAPEEAVEIRVEGERLGVPLGATRVVADYGRPRPSYVFLAVVSLVSLLADLTSKAWAHEHLTPSTVAELVKNHLSLIHAENRGGAWGLLQSTSENVRRPFFLLVSVAAIAFILTLYRRLQPQQRALKWGLPLVLGGALGNLFDRIRYGHVIDFIDYRADWMQRLNELVLHKSDDHWPTFNIADIAICVGVGLMAIDMFTSKRGVVAVHHSPAIPPAQSGEIAVDWNGVPTEVEPAEPEAPPATDTAPAEAPTAAAGDAPAHPTADAPPADVPPAEAPPTK
jgi:signal peptidase II